MGATPIQRQSADWAEVLGHKVQCVHCDPDGRLFLSLRWKSCSLEQRGGGIFQKLRPGPNILAMEEGSPDLQEANLKFAAFKI